MGIYKLMDFIKLNFPKALKSTTINDYRGKVLALDASNWIYQFLIKTQTIKGGTINAPTDWKGNQTGHLIGILSRVLYCLQNDVKTIWVFDGKPPEEKYSQIQRRKKLKQQAQQKMQDARQLGSDFDLLKMSQRTTRISRQQKNDAKKLIQLIGLPVIQSPSQAQPQCAQLVKEGIAYGAISQDMDTLAFGCPRLVRYFSSINQICEIQLQKLLEQSNMSYKQFIDFCILCGCDYTSRIKNIGPKRGYKLIIDNENIDNILKMIAGDEKMFKKHTVDNQFNHFAARKIFQKPQVKKITKKQIDEHKFKFQEDKIYQFLKQRQFSQNRINNWFQKMKNTNYFKDLNS